METFFQFFLNMAFKRQKSIKLRSLFYQTWGVISATWCSSLCNLRLTCQSLEIPLSGSLQWCWCHINWEREGGFERIIFQCTYVNSSPLDFSFVIIKIVLTAQREADMMNWSILSHNLHFNFRVSMTWEWATENEI